MKLRNKKTGEIIKDAQYRNYSTRDGFVISTPTDRYSYKSLKEFCEDWEDYVEPKEPKLDGEVREIVRHWANLHGYDWVRVGFTERASQRIFWVESPDTRKRVDFLGAYVADDFDADDYTITELCGIPEPIEPTFIDLDERVKEKEEE